MDIIRKYALFLLLVALIFLALWLMTRISTLAAIAFTCAVAGFYYLLRKETPDSRAL